MTDFDPKALLVALDGGGGRFVVIGGMAVAAHGFIRATEDLDLVPEPSPANLAAIGNVLVRLDATLPTSGGRRFATRDLAPGVNVTLDTSLGGVDVVQRAPGLPAYRELDEAAAPADLDGVEVRVCSLAHLRAMKAAAGRPIDLADLDALPQS